MQEQLQDNFSEIKNKNTEGIEIGENIFWDKENNQITVFHNGSRIDFAYHKNELMFLSRENHVWDSGEKGFSDKEKNEMKNKALSALKKFQNNSIVTKEMIDGARKFRDDEEERCQGCLDD